MHVLVEPEEQRECRLDLQFLEAGESRAQRRMRLGPVRDDAVVVAQGTEVLRERVWRSLAGSAGRGVFLEGRVEIRLPRPASGAQGEEGPGMDGEVRLVIVATEFPLQRQQVVHMNPVLDVLGVAHEKEIPDQVAVIERLAGRIHGLEDLLGVVDAGMQGGVHHHQLGDPDTQCVQLLRGQLRDLALQEPEILHQAWGRVRREALVRMEKPQQGLPVDRRQEKLVAPFPRLVRVPEEIGADLVRSEAERDTFPGQAPSENRKQHQGWW